MKQESQPSSSEEAEVGPMNDWGKAAPMVMKELSDLSVILKELHLTVLAELKEIRREMAINREIARVELARVHVTPCAEIVQAKERSGELRQIISNILQRTNDQDRQILEQRKEVKALSNRLNAFGVSIILLLAGILAHSFYMGV